MKPPPNAERERLERRERNEAWVVITLAAIYIVFVVAVGVAIGGDAGIAWVIAMFWLGISGGHKVLY